MSKCSLEEANKRKKIFKCPDCPIKKKSLPSLIKHVEKEHKESIPPDNTTKQYIFNRRNKKTHGTCVVCKKETKWNEKKGKYDRLCDDPSCKKKLREKAQKNYLRKLGTDNPASDPSHQIKAIKGRKNSGEYKFQDGGLVGYSSGYEKDFLEFLDKELNIHSKDIQQCDIIFQYEMNGEEKYHIPDFYMPDYNLIIQIKDGGDNPNNNPGVSANKERQRLADTVISKNGRYNYIKIVDKKYDAFINVLKIIRESRLAKEEIIILEIPE